MGPAEEHHAAGDHRKDSFWQVVEDGHEEWDFVGVLICLVCVPLSSQGDSHGCVWRLRTAKHILRSSTGTWVRNNRNTVFYKRFYDTYDCRRGEVGEYDEWSLLRNVFVFIDMSTWCFVYVVQRTSWTKYVVIPGWGLCFQNLSTCWREHWTTQMHQLMQWALPVLVGNIQSCLTPTLELQHSRPF